MAQEIKYTGVNETYVLTFTKIGKSPWYNFYLLALLLVYISIGISVTITFNILNIKGLRHYMKKKNIFIRNMPDVNKKRDVRIKSEVQKSLKKTVRLN